VTAVVAAGSTTRSTAVRRIVSAAPLAIAPTTSVCASSGRLHEDGDRRLEDDATAVRRGQSMDS
jgi:hypothetical protein